LDCLAGCTFGIEMLARGVIPAVDEGDARVGVEQKRHEMRRGQKIFRLGIFG
jgi:hypothetical protein